MLIPITTIKSICYVQYYLLYEIEEIKFSIQIKLLRKSLSPNNDEPLFKYKHKQKGVNS